MLLELAQERRVVAREERRQPLIAPLACDRAAAPDGFERVDTDNAGAFVLFAFLARTLADGGVLPSELGWQWAMQWRRSALTGA